MMRLTDTLAAAGLAGVFACAVAPGWQSIAGQEPAAAAPAPARAALAPGEQDTVILARQGFMEGIYQYMDDAEDATSQDGEVPPALVREAGHLALMMASFKQLFPPSTNPQSPQFSANFETYALGAVWAEPELFSARLDATTKAIYALSMAADRRDFSRGLQAVQATCEGCHDHFRRVYVSPLDPR